jgi:alpha-tubulin suppressor-like RCC1 family protein
MVVSGTVLLKPTLRAADGRLIVARPITWRSTNTAVATVDATGLVTAVAAGDADIIATSEGVSATVRITVGALGQFSSVTAGYGATCALDASGKTFCWGSLARAPGNPLPVSVATDVRFTSLALGTWHTCGLTAAGAAYCWGLNSSQGLGSVATGYLGTGSTASAVTTPEPVTGGLTFASITAGLYYTCGLTPAGIAYCWGSNSHGQLGNGTMSGNGATDEDRLTPTPVLGGLTFASISAGRGGTCGVTTTGAGYCWGSSNGGQLGNGSTGSNSLVPVPVSGGLSFRTISTGGTLDSFGGFACGLTTTGTAYCWGDNPYGQLGSVGSSAVPVPVSGGITFSSLALGETHTCGLATTGAAWCWGRRRLGQLGDGGPEVPEANPVPVAVSGGLSFTQLSAGGGSGHACGLTSGQVAWCWGDGRSGQLGHGVMTSSNVPVRVTGQP